MKKFGIFLLILISFFLIAGCGSSVEYDDTIENFTYKPESEWDYINMLDKSLQYMHFAKR